MVAEPVIPAPVNMNTEQLTQMVNELQTMFEGQRQELVRRAQEHQAQILADCTRLFERDELKLLLHQTFPLAEAATAHACLANGSVVGKLALVVP